MATMAAPPAADASRTADVQELLARLRRFALPGGEEAWHLPEGTFTYYRARTTSVTVVR